MPRLLPLPLLNHPTTAAPDAPVVVRFPALGDTVLLTVLLRALAQRYARPVHLLASGAWTPVLLRHCPAVGELCLVRSRRSPYWLTPSRWSAVDWLHAHSGPVYLCEQDRWAERLIQQAGIAEDRLVRAWRHWPGDTIHWADWWLQIAALDAPAFPGPATAIDVPARPVLARRTLGGGDSRRVRAPARCGGARQRLAARSLAGARDRQRRRSLARGRPGV